MADVRLDHVWKLYDGGVEAVRDVSVDIPAGAFCVLVGPSGCGKSTTLRMIAGLEEISRGSVSIGGREVNDVAPKDRDIAMVFQNYALYPHMTVEKNLSFALRLRGMSRDDIRRRVGKAAEQLGLTELLGRKPGALSGGQRQRVALGRAMVREPSAFLFDEPLSNLDAKLRGSTRAELKALHSRLRTTTVYVTHDQEEAMSLGDMIVVMAGGEVQQAGAPLEVFDRPANRFVAGFIGTPPMNFLEGTLETAGVGLTFVEAGERGARLVVPPDEAETGGEPAAVPSVLGVRPQAAEVIGTDAERASARAAGRLLSVHLDMVEPLGEQMDLHARTAAGAPVVFRVPSRSAVSAGDDLDLVVDVTRVRLFAFGEYGKSLAPARVAGGTDRSIVGSGSAGTGDGAGHG